MEGCGSAVSASCGEMEDTKENVDPPFSRTPASDSSQTHGSLQPPTPQQDDRDDRTTHQNVETQQLADGGEKRQEEEQPRGRRGGWTKGRKRKRSPRDSNAPKAPLTGYHYLDEADKDKERYTKELQQYQKTEAYRSYSRKSQNRQKGRQQRQEGACAVPSGPEKESVLKERPIFDIPIFTEEFLNHSKAREAELRQLRKSNMEFEERNAALQKHVESMRSAVQRLEAELNQEQGRNALLQQHLQSVRQTLTHCLRTVPIPGTSETPTLETIDSYMSRLQSAALTHPKESEPLINGVREVLSQMEG
ncbi:high mobility group protein 20A isoform 2-T2 [Discoglossus pictus]